MRTIFSASRYFQQIILAGVFEAPMNLPVNWIFAVAFFKEPGVDYSPFRFMAMDLYLTSLCPARSIPSHIFRPFPIVTPVVFLIRFALFSHPPLRAIFALEFPSALFGLFR